MARGIEVKICGLTTREDAETALECGADYIGFVLYPPSPRGITAKRMGEIIGSLPGFPKAVGVFVNETRANVEEIAGDCGLHAVQLNGDESAEEFRDMPVRVWRAVRHMDSRWSPAARDWQVSRYVVDSIVPGKYGGTGTLACWSAAAALARDLPVMLAGGLTADNVGEAVRTVKPMGVDVAGGVELGPGRKDPGLVSRFIRAAKGEMKNDE